MAKKENQKRREKKRFSGVAFLNLARLRQERQHAKVPSTIQTFDACSSSSRAAAVSVMNDQRCCCSQPYWS